MTKTIKISSSQFNYQYGDQIHFPYSIAMLYSHIKSKPELFKNFNFEKTFVFRNELDNDINKCMDSDILLCSCYVWNWEITNDLAREVKKINPNCLIVFGGPQVPLDTKGFFDEHPYVDILVHNEGEYVLENILTAYLKNQDYSMVKGITTKDYSTDFEARINELDEIPSPYLTNNVWELVDKVDGIKWIASWETNRGCPYLCTFCDWGSATFTKMRTFSEERLFKEIEWFGDNKIIYVDCCDANFGIYQERDFNLARKLKEVALKTKYPTKIRPAWAKNSSEKIIPIAQELKDGGILGAVTLAVQSLDPDTLKIIKRANIKFDKFSDLTTTFRLHGIPTYTEIILGLPGESLTSYKQGLEVIANTKIDTVFIYNCGVLPNAPMNEPVYKEKYKIKTITSPVMLVHSSVEKDEIKEYEEIVVEAYSYDLDDLKEMRHYSWTYLTMQNLGILELISQYYNQTYNLPYMEFYELFLKFCRTETGLFSKEFEKEIDYTNKGYSGKGWDHFDLNLEDIIWPLEEASWLRLNTNRKNLSESIEMFLVYLEDLKKYDTSKELLNDLILYQTFLLTTFDDKRKIKSESFVYNWKDYFVNGAPLQAQNYEYSYQNPVLESDFKTWCREVIWFGRRSNKFKCHSESLLENKDLNENLKLKSEKI